MIVIKFTNLDGSVSIVHPLPKANIEEIKGLMTDEEYWAHIVDVSVPKDIDASSIVKIESASLPESRYFRNAWISSDAGVQVDFPKACVIKMEKIREVRNKKLFELDTEYLKAIELKDTIKSDSIAAKKQALRDLPQTENLGRFTDLNELESYTPGILI